MSTTSPKGTVTAKWDPKLVERTMSVLRPFLKLYHRCEVHGLDRFPNGGALVVSNHSGGLFPMDVPVFASAFYEEFGYGRAIYTLSHDLMLTGPTADFFIRNGFIRANHENADEALRSGGVVVVFPGVTTTSTDRHSPRTRSTSTAASAM